MSNYFTDLETAKSFAPRINELVNKIGLFSSEKSPASINNAQAVLAVSLISILNQLEELTVGYEEYQDPPGNSPGSEARRIIQSVRNCFTVEVEKETSRTHVTGIQVDTLQESIFTLLGLLGQ